MKLLEVFAPVIVVLMPVISLLGCWLIGYWQERRHFRMLEQAEEELSGILYTDLKRIPANWQATDGWIVCGEAVIARDKFKVWLAGWSNFFGGRVSSYEPLLERARREAIVRMLREAKERDANAVWNVRIVTSTISGGIEAMAFGTAICTTQRGAKAA